MFPKKWFPRAALLIAGLIGGSLIALPSSAAVPAIHVNIIDAGGKSTCALRANNDVLCVGENDAGELGQSGVTGDRSEPLPVGVTAALSVSMGKTSGCAIGADQKGYCWGLNNKGQLGNTAPGNLARPISLASKLIDISVGETYACAITIEGKLYCWGEFVNFSSTLSSTIPVQIGSSTSFKTVSVGDSAVCAVSSDVYCFGPLVTSQDLVKIDRSTAATGVAVGNNFACFLISKSVRCFGDNSQGQLGQSNTTVTSEVRDVSGISDASSIVAGAKHACALTTNGTVYCWGDNSANQIVTGGVDQLVRVPVSFTKTLAITAGDAFTCALLLDASIKCIGDNSSGQSAVLPSSTAPLESLSIRSVAQVSSGNTTTCAVTTAGSLKCAGELIPEIEPGAQFTQVAVGNVSACAIRVDGAVLCWGGNGSGQLGDNSSRSAVEPVQVIGIETRKAISIAAGFRHFCAAMDDGLVLCWGDNSKGQLGFTGLDSRTAVAVSGIGNAKSVAVGDYHSCALLITNKVMCWGDNAKREINATVATTLPVTLIDSAKDVSAIAAGGFNTCYIYADQSAGCFGDNTEWQAVESITGTFIDISVGGKTVCLISTTDGTSCLGSNASNKLGRVGLKSGTLVDTGIGAKRVSVGIDHVCLRGLSDSLHCWGSNNFGQLAASHGFPSPFIDPVVTITGKANVGETLSVVVTPKDTSVTSTVSWYRASTLTGTYSKLLNQTNATLVPTVSDQGRFFKAYITLNKWGTSSKVFRSSATVAIGKQLRLLLTPTPTVTGNAKVGNQLVARPGRWETGVKLSYQWYRGASVIGGANKANYRITKDDVGKQLRVAVNGTKTGLAKVAVKSLPTVKVVR